MLGQNRTQRPRTTLRRLTIVNQLRSRFDAPLPNPDARPKMPETKTHAPNSIVNAKRLIDGQRRMMTPTATAQRPFRPSAQRNFVSCVPTLSARPDTDSMGDLLLVI